MSCWIRYAPLVAYLGVFVSISDAHAEVFRFSASRNEAHRQQIKLPAAWVFCEGNNPKQTIQLAAGKTQENVELVAVPAGGAPSCDDSVKRVSSTVELLPTVLTVNDVKPEDVALDWSSSAPEKLHVWVRSPLLVRDAALREKIRIKADGVNAQQALDCDAGRDVCIFEVTGGRAWRERTTVRVEVESEGIVRAVLSSQPVYLAETGALLAQDALPAYDVNRWVSRDLSPVQRIVVTDSKLLEPLIELSLQNDLFRFVRVDARPCAEPAGQGNACAQVLNGPPRLELNLTANKEALREHLRQGKQIRVEGLHLENVTLVKRSLEPESAALHTPMAVISRGACPYQLRQMHKVFAGTRSGRVYFDVDVPPGCLRPEGWVAASEDERVRPGKTRRVGDRKLEVRFEELRGDEDFEAVLKFSRQDGAALQAQAVLVVDRPVTLTVEGIRTCLSSGGSAQCQQTPQKESGDTPTEPDSKNAGGKGRGSMTQWRQDRSVLDHLDVLGVGKNNLVRISSSSQTELLFDIESGPIRFCDGSPRQSKPVTRPVELCLEATKAEDALPKLRVRVAPFADALGLRPEDSVEIRRDNGTVDTGWQSLTIPARPVEIRFAYPLRRRTYLACPNPDGVDVNSLDNKEQNTFVPSHGGVRAVQMTRRRESGSCELRFELPLTHAQSKALAKLVEERKGHTRDRSACFQKEENCAKAEQALQEGLQAVYAKFLDEMGPQRFTLKAEMIQNKGDAFSNVDFWPQEIVLDRNLTFANESGTWLAFDEDSSSVVDIVWEIDLLQGGSISPPDYGELRLSIGHADAKEKYLPSFQGEEVKLDGFQAHLRRMPDRNTLPGFARERLTGRGVRGYVSFQIPIGVLRTKNTGFGATTSSSYSQLETASFGAGAVYTIEPWNFNTNEPLTPLNIQANLGLLLNTDLNRLTDLGRLRGSAIVGLAFRLPGGTLPNTTAETSLSLLLWYELTAGREQEFQHGFLLGLGAKFGSWGN